MFENLPNKYKSLRYFIIFGFVLSIFMPIILSFLSGSRIAILGCTFVENHFEACHSIIPTNAFELGRFTADTGTWVFGSLVVYWWEIGRKKNAR